MTRRRRLRILTTALVLLISPTYPWMYSYQGPDGFGWGTHLVSWLDPLVWSYGNWFPVVAVLLAAFAVTLGAVAMLRPAGRCATIDARWIHAALTTAPAVAAWLALLLAGGFGFPSVLAPCVLSLAAGASVGEMIAGQKPRDLAR